MLEHGLLLQSELASRKAFGGHHNITGHLIAQLAQLQTDSIVLRFGNDKRFTVRIYSLCITIGEGKSFRWMQSVTKRTRAKSGVTPGKERRSKHKVRIRVTFVNVVGSESSPYWLPH